MKALNEIKSERQNNQTMKIQKTVHGMRDEFQQSIAPSHMVNLLETVQ